MDSEMFKCSSFNNDTDVTSEIRLQVKSVSIKLNVAHIFMLQ